MGEPAKKREKIMAKNGNRDDNDRARIEVALEFFGIEKPSTTAERLALYAEMVSERRKWGNLASSFWDEDWARPIIESVALTTVLDRARALRIADIGAGGGLLGMVVALACPQWNVTAIESAGRKGTFMAETAGKLGLKNLLVAKERAESLVGDRTFDTVISRAAGAVEKMIPLAAGLLEKSGVYVGLKGSDPSTEVREAAGVIESSGFRIEVVRVALPPGEKGQISLVKASKM